MNSFVLPVAAPITHSFIFVPLVTLLFRVSTTCMVPLLVVVVVRSNLLFSNFISTVFASHGFIVTGMIIGSIPGMFIVIVSFPALKLGYNVMLLFHEIMKLFDDLKTNCVLLPVAVGMIFGSIVHIFNNHCLLVMFATVVNDVAALLRSLISIVMLGIFAGMICAVPSPSIYWILASSFGKLNVIFGGLLCVLFV
jgi:hypothetical protein